ncbi:hypothetical protein [Comamonas sp. AG1104]|uniref:hypothetical protein n=1 Tax=Comamonas sp. AG1104 TaxID=2183900 RepID=UPI0011C01EF3|nr:hypothetical protein [Comamonas sp. AG1104]
MKISCVFITLGRCGKREVPKAYRARTFLERELPGAVGKLLLACHAYHLKRRAMQIRAKLADNDFRLVEAACGGYFGW